MEGPARKEAIEAIKHNHYTHSVPSGKSYYLKVYDALVVWSIPANKNIAKFVLGREGSVWELSRLWAPDNHGKNLLTLAIGQAVRFIKRTENPDALVSYADPSQGHHGGVYRAASWQHHGTSEEVRAYRTVEGQVVSRRAFHSGNRSLKKAEIEALGYVELRLPGKERFVKKLNRRPLKGVM